MIVELRIAAKTNMVQLILVIGSRRLKTWEKTIWFPLTWFNACVCRDAVTGRVSLVLGSIYTCCFLQAVLGKICPIQEIL